MPKVIILFAKILMSGIGIVDIRGKINGTVMSKGKSGAIARVKVTPVNPQTAYQQRIRSILAYFSGKFRSLSLDQINGWNAAAANGFKGTNIFGNQFSNSGIGLYVGLNINLQVAQVAEITDAPIPESVANPLGISPTAAAGASSMFVNAEFTGGVDVIPANTSLVILGTPPVSRGVTFVKSKYRIVAVLLTTQDTGTFDIGSDYESKFGNLVAGQKIFLKAVAVNTTTGQAGIPIAFQLTVAA